MAVSSSMPGYVEPTGFANTPATEAPTSTPSVAPGLGPAPARNAMLHAGASEAPIPAATGMRISARQYVMQPRNEWYARASAAGTSADALEEDPQFSATDEDSVADDGQAADKDDELQGGKSDSEEPAPASGKEDDDDELQGGKSDSESPRFSDNEPDSPPEATNSNRRAEALVETASTPAPAIGSKRRRNRMQAAPPIRSSPA